MNCMLVKLSAVCLVTELNLCLLTCTQLAYLSFQFHFKRVIRRNRFSTFIVLCGELFLELLCCSWHRTRDLLSASSNVATARSHRIRTSMLVATGLTMRESATFVSEWSSTLTNRGCCRSAKIACWLVIISRVRWLTRFNSGGLSCSNHNQAGRPLCSTDRDEVVLYTTPMYSTLNCITEYKQRGSTQSVRVKLIVRQK